MSTIAISYICSCSEARLGLVDGDTGKVYCGSCEGVLGDVEDFYGTRIPVKQSYSFTEYITVQIRDEDGEVLECNHAGYEEEPLEFTAYSSYDGGAYTAPDDSYTETFPVCDKCGAWQDGDGTWRENE